jgi:hypothetical protein
VILIEEHIGDHAVAVGQRRVSIDLADDLLQREDVLPEICATGIRVEA